jgi:hypothetical protein
VQDELSSANWLISACTALNGNTAPMNFERVPFFYRDSRCREIYRWLVQKAIERDLDNVVQPSGRVGISPILGPLPRAVPPQTYFGI